MSINTLNARLEAINDECENAIKLKLSKFHTDLHSDNSELYIPSPQVIEALWFDLITEKEHKFIREIALTLNKPDTFLSIENTRSIEKTINTVFAYNQYLSRMKEFYKKLDKMTILNETTVNSVTNKMDLIDSAYQEGISKRLHKSRNRVMAEVELHKKTELNNLGMIELWKKYSTLSPLRAIGTIFLLYCTSLLIAWIIKGDVFQQYIKQFGWSVGQEW
jgi:hypothetical protein